MANNINPQTASGRTFTNPPLSADPIRYQFLNLNNAEPNLSLPTIGNNPSNDLYALLSDPLTGGRFWSNNSLAVDIYSNYVGMGTDVPNNKLTVIGNISATGYIYGNIFNPSIPAAAGISSSVQFNSNGALSGDPGFTFIENLSAIVVGQGNSTTGLQTSILGGQNNSATGNTGFIGGGTNNANIGSTGGVIGGGKENSEQGDYGFIGGGRSNTANDTYAVTVGGYDNSNSGLASFIGGGQCNVITNGTQNNGILGGNNNLIQHDNSFIIGNNLRSLSSNYTYVNHIEVDGQSIFNGSIGEGIVTVHPVLSSTVIDLLSATTFNLQLSTSVNTFSIINAIPNLVNSFTMFVFQPFEGGQVVNWSFNGSLVKWQNRTAPMVTLSSYGIDVFSFVSNNGGITWYGFIGAQNLGY